MADDLLPRKPVWGFPQPVSVHGRPAQPQLAPSAECVAHCEPVAATFKGKEAIYDHQKLAATYTVAVAPQMWIGR